MGPGSWRASRRQGAGYSTLELLAALTIAAILLAAAAPSFVSAVHDNRIASLTNLLLADVHLTRMEAIMRHQDVVLCRSKDGRHCDPSARAKSDWSNGWIVYVNADGDKKRDPGEPLLRARSLIPEGLTLRFNQWWRVIYHGDGSAKNGSFTLCDFRGPEAARTLILFYTGRPRISNRKANGDPVDCS